ncbi:hypothetical protein LMG6871_02682 [Ralstonia edaphis]|uniref:phospholipase effector Tle1 domain-containing protein n=1 Tax=Ralstonia edaphi TaxID=3058599 RepID=UPI0028F4D7D0|nr:DUF2235 domain-containing protein [Ralstonia sp. LMG 6871]CAJ0719080.1 hypothetical protein LMG6871_02682 [Ralstonia sp. LMG 6871]
MSAPISAPNRNLPLDPAEWCSLTPIEVSPSPRYKRMLKYHDPLRCETIVQVGLFFDGTNNNLVRDFDEQPPQKRYHSNIVRLFRGYPSDKDNVLGNSERFYRFYMPGVGTRFPEIGENAESTYGRAFAAGGQARILWGLMQVYNAVHRTVHDDFPMLRPDEIAEKIKDYAQKVDHHQKDGVFPDSPALDRKGWFAKLTQELSAKLRHKLDLKPKPAIPFISISVFGFSRGAVQARAFCYWFQDALQNGQFAGIDTEISFLGLFDSVATVGTSDSMNKAMALPQWIASGHSGWAAEILKPLPSVVKKTVHYIAAHEQRMNFPSTRVTSPNPVEEVLYPGMHSDVGGGYGAGSQGKARNGLSSLMSQIPLLHMYKAALLAGVPLHPYEKLQGDVKDDLQVDPQMVQAWDRYMTWSGCTDGDYEAEVLKHMACYFRWRQQLLPVLEQAPFYLAGNGQDRQDLHESNSRLKGDLHLVRLRAAPFRSPYGGRSDAILVSPEEMARANFMQIRAANMDQPVTPFEVFALRFFDTPQGVPRGAGDLLNDYMHDSLAGFYLAGAVTELDMKIATAKACNVKLRGWAMNGFEKKIYLQFKDWIDQRGAEGRDCSNTDPKKGPIDAPSNMEDFPIQTDEDVSDFRDWVIVSQTTTRREGGGYLRNRVTFVPDR